MRNRFKLEFRCIELKAADGKTKVRALIIAVAPVPGVEGWLNAVLALDNGGVIQKTITKVDFDRAEHNQVTVVEADDVKGPPVLYVPGGTAA